MNLFARAAIRALAALLCCGAAWAAGPLPEPATGYGAKQAVFAPRFMVVAANPLAVEAGVRMLERGGSAADAAIAAQLVLNLVEPQSSGIGGGTFVLHYDARAKKLVAYDGRETAPKSATPRLFLDPEGRPLEFYRAVVGGRSVGVPGTLRALELLHRRHGRLPWRALFQPAIRLAEEGFPVSPRLHALLARDRYLPREEPARRYFYHPDGSPRAVGERLKNPALARLLRRVARRGADAFYTGPVARDIAAAVRNHPANPGGLAPADLAAYRAKPREPLCGRYRVYRVCGMPPPSAGGTTLLAMLGMLERFPLADRPPGSAAAVHLFSEAGRLAYADRDRYLADPDFVPVPVAALIAPDYLARRAALIDRHRSMGRAEPGEPLPHGAGGREGGVAPELPATTHISVVDGRGNAVSMTSSVENAFGSRILVHGFLLNNQLTDFSFLPEAQGGPAANRVEPGKRPRSSMAPTVVFDAAGNARLIIGSPGGGAIINFVAKTLVGVLDWGLDIQQAIDLPNFGSRNGPTELEAGTTLEALAEPLRALGHEVTVTDLNSGLHGIEKTPSGWLGGADPRREGTAAGG